MLLRLYFPVLQEILLFKFLKSQKRQKERIGVNIRCTVYNLLLIFFRIPVTYIKSSLTPYLTLGFKLCTLSRVTLTICELTPSCMPKEGQTGENIQYDAAVMVVYGCVHMTTNSSGNL